MLLIITHLLMFFHLVVTQTPKENSEILKLLILSQDNQNTTSELLREAIFISNNASSTMKYDFDILQVDANINTISNLEMCEYYKNNVLIILDITSNNFDWATTSKTANDFNMIYLKIDLSIAPILKILDAYLHVRNATDIVVIFENDTDADKALIYWLDRTTLRLRVINGMNNDTLAGLRYTIVTPSFYIVIAHTKNMLTMLKMAKSNALFQLPERWVFLFLDIGDQNEIRSLLSGLPVSLLSLKAQMCCLGQEYSASTCNCSNDSLNQIFLKKFVNYVTKIFDDFYNRDLAISSTLNCSTPRKFPTKLFYDYVTTRPQNIFKFDENLIFSLNIDAIIELGRKNGEFDLLGTYSELKLNLVEGKKIKPNKMFFRVATGIATPWIYRETNPDTGEVSVEGYCIDLIEKLAEVMDFNYDLGISDGNYGELLPNGTWDGLIGGLITGEIDMVVAPMTMTAAREEVVDFVTPYFETTGITIVARKPVMKTSLFKFLKVLSSEVWYSIIGALLITTLILWILHYCSPFSSRNRKYPYPCREFDFKESFWFALTSFTPQGGGEVPQSLSGRTLVAAYWIFVVLILITFTANLSAFLTVERMQLLPPQFNLEELTRQSRINYTVKKDSWPFAYFKNMRNTEDQLYHLWRELALNKTDQYRIWDYPIKEQYGNIVKAIIEAVPVLNMSEGYRMVLEHTDADFAFIHDYSEVRYALGRMCNLIEIGEPFAERPYAIAVQQGSLLLGDVSKALGELQRNGYLKFLKDKYWGVKENKNCEEEDVTEGITISSLGGVFIATLSVLLLAIITLIFEIVNIKRYTSRNKNIKRDKKEIFFVKNTQLMFQNNDAADNQHNKIGNSKPVTIGLNFRPVVRPRVRDGANEVKEVNRFIVNSRQSIYPIDYWN